MIDQFGKDKLQTISAAFVVASVEALLQHRASHVFGLCLGSQSQVCKTEIFFWKARHCLLIELKIKNITMKV
jgi:hypothetical protein